VQPLPPIDCDVSALTNADELALEALTRLQLAAQRMGTSIRLRNASAQLVDLLALFGLSDVLPIVGEQAAPSDPEAADDSGVESDGQVEERE
jgi:anti-anti-sigma regulatory factor